MIEVAPHWLVEHVHKAGHGDTALSQAHAERVGGHQRTTFTRRGRGGGRLGRGDRGLDTGPRQPRAQRMYGRAGYRAIENFNGSPVASYFAEKALA